MEFRDFIEGKVRDRGLHARPHTTDMYYTGYPSPKKGPPIYLQQYYGLSPYTKVARRPYNIRGRQVDLDASANPLAQILTSLYGGTFNVFMNKLGSLAEPSIMPQNEPLRKLFAGLGEKGITIPGFVTRQDLAKYGDRAYYKTIRDAYNRIARERNELNHQKPAENTVESQKLMHLTKLIRTLDWQTWDLIEKKTTQDGQNFKVFVPFSNKRKEW